MHRLLGAVHEAAVQLSKLPIGDVTAALLQVLRQTEWRSGEAHRPRASPAPPADEPQSPYCQPLSEEAHVGDPIVDLGQHVLQVLG